MKAYRRILHASDFSPASAAAYANAVTAARQNRAELILVHVMSPVIPLVDYGYISPQVYDDLERGARQQAQKQLDRLVTRARKSGARVTPMLLDGVAAEQIVRAAKARRADVIVMGTHGRTGLPRLFLGSVAERVVGTAPCPVLTVRGTRGRPTSPASRAKRTQR